MANSSLTEGMSPKQKKPESITSLTVGEARDLVAIANKEREQKLDKVLIEIYQQIHAVASMGTTYTNWECEDEDEDNLYLVNRLRAMGYSAILNYDNATIDISWKDPEKISHPNAL